MAGVRFEVDSLKSFNDQLERFNTVSTKVNAKLIKSGESFDSFLRVFTKARVNNLREFNTQMLKTTYVFEKLSTTNFSGFKVSSITDLNSAMRSFQKIDLSGINKQLEDFTKIFSKLSSDKTGLINTYIIQDLEKFSSKLDGLKINIDLDKLDAFKKLFAFIKKLEEQKISSVNVMKNLKAINDIIDYSKNMNFGKLSNLKNMFKLNIFDGFKKDSVNVINYNTITKNIRNLIKIFDVLENTNIRFTHIEIKLKMLQILFNLLNFKISFKNNEDKLSLMLSFLKNVKKIVDVLKVIEIDSIDINTVSLGIKKILELGKHKVHKTGDLTILLKFVRDINKIFDILFLSKNPLPKIVEWEEATKRIFEMFGSKKIRNLKFNVDFDAFSSQINKFINMISKFANSNFDYFKVVANLKILETVVDEFVSNKLFKKSLFTKIQKTFKGGLFGNIDLTEQVERTLKVFRSIGEFTKSMSSMLGLTTTGTTSASTTIATINDLLDALYIDNKNRFNSKNNFFTDTKNIREFKKVGEVVSSIETMFKIFSKISTSNYDTKKIQKNINDINFMGDEFTKAAAWSGRGGGIFTTFKNANNNTKQVEVLVNSLLKISEAFNKISSIDINRSTINNNLNGLRDILNAVADIDPGKWFTKLINLPFSGKKLNDLATIFGRSSIFKQLGQTGNIEATEKMANSLLSLSTSFGKIATIDIDQDKILENLEAMKTIINVFSGENFFEKFLKESRAIGTDTGRGLFDHLETWFGRSQFQKIADVTQFEKISKLSTSMQKIVVSLKDMTSFNIDMDVLKNNLDAIRILTASFTGYTGTEKIVGFLKGFSNPLESFQKTLETFGKAKIFSELGKVKDVEKIYQLTSSILKAVEALNKIGSIRFDADTIRSNMMVFVEFMDLFLKGKGFNIFDPSTWFKKIDGILSMVKNTTKDLGKISSLTNSIYKLATAFQILAKIDFDNFDPKKFIKALQYIQKNLTLISKGKPAQEGDEYGEGFLSGLKKSLKIQSPSKEMIKIGEQASEGFMMGLQKNLNPVNMVKSVLGAIGKIGKSIAQQMTSMSAVGSVKLVLDTIKGYYKAVEGVVRKIGSFFKPFTGMFRSLTGIIRFELNDIVRIGRSLLQVGVGNAIDLQQQMAMVTKSLDIEDSQIPVLTQQLREMSFQSDSLLSALPEARNEILSIAKIAGQLGIAPEDVAGFTETVGLIGLSTDLTSEAAATFFGQFGAITQMAADEYNALGSSLVNLGNNFATTEPQITEMALRIAAAGKAAGLTESEILALSAAATSVGINAEAGGTAFTELLTRVTKATASGGKELQEFARIAGVSADEFTKSWRDDPTKALSGFVDGLGKLTGEEQITALEELGMSGIRLQLLVRSLGGAEGQLAEAVEIANEGWKTQNAHFKEGEVLARTTQSSINRVKNVFKELSTSFGMIIRDSLPKIIDGFGEFLLVINDFINNNLVYFQQYFDNIFNSLSRFLGLFTELASSIGTYITSVVNLRNNNQETINSVKALTDNFVSFKDVVVSVIENISKLFRIMALENHMLATPQFPMPAEMQETPLEGQVEAIEEVTMAYETYKIKAGDTLWDIANQSGITLEELMKLNNFEPKDAKLLQIGAEIVINGKKPDEITTDDIVPTNKTPTIELGWDLKPNSEGTFFSGKPNEDFGNLKNFNLMDEIMKKLVGEGDIENNKTVELFNTLRAKLSDIEGLLKTISELDFSKVTDFMGSIATSVLSGMSVNSIGLLGTFTLVLNSVSGVITSIIEYIENIDEERMSKIENTIKLVVAAFSIWGTITALPSIVMLLGIAAALNGLKYAIDPLFDAITDLGDSIYKLFTGDTEGALQSFKGFTENLTLAVTEFWRGLKEFSFNLLSTLLGKSPEELEQDFNTTVIVLQTFAESAMSAFTNLAINIGGWLLEQVARLKLQILDLIIPVLDIAGVIDENAKNEASRLRGEREYTSMGIQIGEELYKGIEEGLDAKFNTYDANGNPIVKTLGDILTDENVYNNLTARSKSQLQTFLQGLLNEGDLDDYVKIVELSDLYGFEFDFTNVTLPETIEVTSLESYIEAEALNKLAGGTIEISVPEDFIKLNSDELATALSGETNMNAIKNAVKEFVPQLLTGTHWTDLMSSVELDDLDHQDATVISQLIVDAIKNGYDEEAIKTEIKDFVGEDKFLYSMFMEIIKDQLSSTEGFDTSVFGIDSIGKDVGKDLISGIETGLNDNKEQLGITAEEAAFEMLTQMKDTLGIKSPSTVGIEIGQFFVDGVVSGLNSNLLALQLTLTSIGMMFYTLYTSTALSLMLFNISYANAVIAFKTQSEIFKTELDGVRDKVNEVIGSLGNMQVGVSVAVGTGGGYTPEGRYYGGAVQSGKVYEILEDDLPFETFTTGKKTYFITGKSGYITSPADSRSLLSAAGVGSTTTTNNNSSSESIVFNINGVTDPEQVANTVIKKLERHSKNYSANRRIKSLGGS